MPDSKETPPQASSLGSRLKQWVVPAIILLLAVGVVLLITTNWNAWASGRTVQETDDAYLHADLTPLSTKVAGLVATVAVSDYQAVRPEICS
jgi:membrane fusion protein (multidrug efflux system)